MDGFGFTVDLLDGFGLVGLQISRNRRPKKNGMVYVKLLGLFKGTCLIYSESLNLYVQTCRHQLRSAGSLVED